MSSTAPSSRDGTVSVRSLIEMLAATLGWEKSSEVVNAMVQRLGLPAALVTPAQASMLLSELAKAPGMVGVTARFARSRMEFSVPPSGPTSGRSSIVAQTPTEDSAQSPKKSATRSLLMGELVGLLASTVGQDRAEESVLEAVRRLGLSTRSFSRDQTMVVLNDLASRPGLVGVTARFAMARAILLLGG